MKLAYSSGKLGKESVEEMVQLTLRLISHGFSG